MVITSPLQTLHERSLMQYRTSPNFMDFKRMYAEELQITYNTLQQCLTDRYYDVAIGAQLDVIAEIVGADRTLSGVVVSGHFGYLRVAEALGMGREDSPSLGGPFRSFYADGVQDIELSDADLRHWIDARIIKNSSNCNIEDVISFFSLLLNDPVVQIELTEPEPAVGHIKIWKELSLTEAALIKSVSQHIKCIGVSVRVFDTLGEIQTLPVPYKR